VRRRCVPQWTSASTRRFAADADAHAHTVHGTVLPDADAGCDAGSDTAPDTGPDGCATDDSTDGRPDTNAERDAAHTTAADTHTDTHTVADSGCNAQRASRCCRGRTRRRGSDDRFVRVDLAALSQLIYVG
jgi:hypothetical protein